MAKRAWKRFVDFLARHVDETDVDDAVKDLKGWTSKPRAEAELLEAQAARTLLDGMANAPQDACVMTSAHLAVKTDRLIGVRRLTPDEQAAFQRGELEEISQNPQAGAELFLEVIDATDPLKVMDASDEVEVLEATEAEKAQITTS